MAIAAPATPAFSTTTKKISPAIFRQTETASMISGVTVSPSALSAAAHASYKNVATSPAIIIKIYDTAIPIKSFDTFKNPRILRKNNRHNTVIASAIMHPILIDSANDFFTPA